MFDTTRVAVTSTPTATRVVPGVVDARRSTMRQYDDPVEVRRGQTQGPDQFLWRGRLWKVRAVLAHWVETGPWWQTAEADQQEVGSAADLVAERELWRVEAGRGRDLEGLDVAGVFDLSFDWTDGRWQLVGCAD